MGERGPVCYASHRRHGLPFSVVSPRTWSGSGSGEVWPSSRETMAQHSVKPENVWNGGHSALRLFGLGEQRAGKDRFPWHR